jgi:hypothetical protein
MVLALLVMVVHRHEGHLHPCLSGVQPNRERWSRGCVAPHHRLVPIGLLVLVVVVSML